METTTESDSLLPKDIVTNAHQPNKLNFFVSLGIVLLVFKGSEEIASSGFKQYVYFWCKQYLNKSDTIAANSSNDGFRDSGTDACGEDKSSESEEDAAQAMASQWQMYYEILSAVLVFISTSVYGTLTDFVGRKKIGMLSLFGYAMRCAICTVVVYLDIHVAYFLIAYIVDGLCGSVTTFSLVCYASSADITDNVKDRVFAVALIEAMIGTGILTTDIATGYFIKRYGYFYPFLTAACGMFFCFLLAIVLLTETKVHNGSKQIQTKTESTRCGLPSCMTLFYNYVGFYTSKEQTGKRVFWLSLVVFFLVEFVIFGRSNPLTLYQLGRPFCWTSELIGWYSGAYMAATYVLGIIALKPILHVVSEHVAACVGIISSIAINTIIALATTTLQFFIAIAAGCLSALPKSIIRGMVSSRVSGQKQGAVYAGLMSSELICKLVAGPICLSIYSHTLDTMRGSLFLVLAGVCGLTLILQMWLSILVRNENQKKDVTIIVEPPDNRALDSNETQSNSASHPDPNCLTMRLYFSEEIRKEQLQTYRRQHFQEEH